MQWIAIFGVFLAIVIVGLGVSQVSTFQSDNSGQTGVIATAISQVGLWWILAFAFLGIVFMAAIVIIVMRKS